jgi:hypothetical protein
LSERIAASTAREGGKQGVYDHPLVPLAFDLGARPARGPEAAGALEPVTALPEADLRDKAGA